MELLKLESSRIILPDSIIEQLHLEEGEYLSAQLVDGNIILMPVSVGEDEYDWAKFDEIRNRPKLRPDQPVRDDEQEGQWIAQQIREMRAEEHTTHHAALIIW